MYALSPIFLRQIRSNDYVLEVISLELQSVCRWSALSFQNANCSMLHCKVQKNHQNCSSICMNEFPSLHLMPTCCCCSSRHYSNFFTANHFIHINHSLNSSVGIIMYQWTSIIYFYCETSPNSFLLLSQHVSLDVLLTEALYSSQAG